MLKNTSFLAKFRFDTDENERSKIGNLAKISKNGVTEAPRAGGLDAHDALARQAAEVAAGEAAVAERESRVAASV